jgi:twitching motility two-component system response regulator PilH
MKTVLVVEDTLTDQRLIVALLQQVGLNVVCVDSAESALQWLAMNQKPDLIVLDIVMPGINGLDLCRQLRANPDFEDISIVFCSSKDQEFDRFWALRQGGDAYIAKPFAPLDLVQTVCSYLS